MGSVEIIVLVIFMIISFGVLGLNFKIVPESQAYVIERLGSYFRTWNAGLYFKIPFIDRIAYKVNLTEQNLKVLVKPESTERVYNVDIYYQVTNPKLYVYAVKSPLEAIKHLVTQTCLEILHESNSLKQSLETNLSAILGEKVKPWGIVINYTVVK